MTHLDGVHAFFQAVKAELRVRRRLFFSLFILMLFSITFFALTITPYYIASTTLDRPTPKPHHTENTLYRDIERQINTETFLLTQNETEAVNKLFILDNLSISHEGSSTVRLQLKAKNKTLALDGLNTVASSLIHTVKNKEKLPKVYLQLEEQLKHYGNKIKENQVQQAKMENKKNIINQQKIAAEKNRINEEIHAISLKIEDTENNLEIIFLDIQAAQNSSLLDSVYHIEKLQKKILKEKAIIQQQRAQLKNLEKLLLNEYEKEIQFSSDLTTIENLENEYLGLQQAYEKVENEKARFIDLFDINDERLTINITQLQPAVITSQPSIDRQHVLLSALIAAITIPLLIAAIMVKTGSAIRLPQKLNAIFGETQLPLATLTHMRSQLSYRTLKNELIYIGAALVIYFIIIIASNSSITLFTTIGSL